MIKIVLLGAGNVATHLFKVFRDAEDVSVTQWYNRQANTLSTYKNEVEITDNLEDLKPADVYIMAISDDAISEVSKALPFQDQFVVHTSGTVSLYDLDKKNRRGVFYPLQTFSKDANVDFSQVPLCVEALVKTDLKLLIKLAKAIGSPSYKISTEQRKTLHIAAVFANNFTNQLYRIAHEITESDQIEFEVLKPLIQETARKIQDMSPYMAQTGPAVRGDKKTVKQHLKRLKNPNHKAIYQLLTDSITYTHGGKKL